jgi:branched-chain amino acid transport system permease protein
MKRASLRSAASVVVVTLVISGFAALALPGYWIYLATAVLITAVNLLSLGVVEGRTGMISLCQLSFAGVGAWTVGYLNVAGAPGGLPVWILIGGLAAMPFGVAIGPAGAQAARHQSRHRHARLCRRLRCGARRQHLSGPDAVPAGAAS